MVWALLGSVAPVDLVDARLQLHHAAQIVSAGAMALLEPALDDSHPNLGWDEANRALVSRRLSADGVTLALAIERFEIEARDGEGRAAARVSLHGRTPGDALEDATHALAEAGVIVAAPGLPRSPYDLPDHPVARGAKFERPDPAASGQLAAWFAAAFDVLGARADAHPGAAPLRVWPHHFDAGSLFAVDTAPDGTAQSTVGFGLSLGDESYAEPYWYVSVWPAPSADALPDVEGPGHWHTDGFTAAVLTASEMSCESVAAQRAGVERFIAGRVDASQAALRAGVV